MAYPMDESGGSNHTNTLSSRPHPMDELREPMPHPMDEMFGLLTSPPPPPPPPRQPQRDETTTLGALALADTPMKRPERGRLSECTPTKSPDPESVPPPPPGRVAAAVKQLEAGTKTPSPPPPPPPRRRRVDSFSPIPPPPPPRPLRPSPAKSVPLPPLTPQELDDLRRSDPLFKAPGWLTVDDLASIIVVQSVARRWITNTYIMPYLRALKIGGAGGGDACGSEVMTTLSTEERGRIRRELVFAAMKKRAKQGLEADSGNGGKESSPMISEKDDRESDSKEKNVCDEIEPQSRQEDKEEGEPESVVEDQENEPPKTLSRSVEKKESGHAKNKKSAKKLPGEASLLVSFCDVSAIPEQGDISVFQEGTDKEVSQSRGDFNASQAGDDFNMTAIYEEVCGSVGISRVAIYEECGSSEKSKESSANMTAIFEEVCKAAGHTATPGEGGIEEHGEGTTATILEKSVDNFVTPLKIGSTGVSDGSAATYSIQSPQGSPSDCESQKVAANINAVSGKKPTCQMWFKVIFMIILPFAMASAGLYCWYTYLGVEKLDSAFDNLAGGDAEVAESSLVDGDGLVPASQPTPVPMLTDGESFAPALQPTAVPMIKPTSPVSTTLGPASPNSNVLGPTLPSSNFDASNGVIIEPISNIPTSLPTVPPFDGHSTFSFYVFGDVPYSVEEEKIIEYQLDRLTIDTVLYQDNEGSAFVIHVGDIMKGGQRADCEQWRYRLVEDMFKQYSKLPPLMIPGDNDWIDCPDPNVGWQRWVESFVPIELHWNDKSSIPGKVERQERRQENFAFAHNGVLFLGLNLNTKGVWDDELEIRQRWDDNAAWVADKVRWHSFSKEGTDPNAIRAIFLFGHGRSLGFWKQNKDLLYPLDVPVVYIHGNGHTFEVSQPFSDWNSFWIVQVDQGGIAPPARVTIQGTTDMAKANPVMKESPYHWMFGNTINLDRRGGADKGPWSTSSDW